MSKTLFTIIASFLFSAGLFAQCSVLDVPTVAQGSSVCYINNLTVDAFPISVNSGVESPGNSYQSFSSPYILMTQGQQHQVWVDGAHTTLFNECIWIDFNNDSIFTSAELCAYIVNSNFSAYNYSINVPFDAVADTLHMRVMRLQGSGGWGGGNDDACFDYGGHGEVEDYLVIMSCGNYNFANFDPFPFICYADSVELFASTQYGDITWYTDSSAAPSYTGNNFTLHLNSYTQDTTIFIQNTAGGCFDGPLLEMIVNFTPIPVVNIAGPDSVQSCTAVTFDAGPGHSIYVWSNGDQTQTTTITNGWGGNLSVSVDDGMGCMATDQVWVNIAPNPPGTYASLSTGINFCSDQGIYLTYDSLVNPGTVNWYTYPANSFVGIGSYLAYTLPDTGLFQFTAVITSMCGTDTGLVSIYSDGGARYDSLYSQTGTRDSLGVYHICPGTGVVTLIVGGLQGTVSEWAVGDTASGNWFTFYDDDTLSLPVFLMQTGVTYAAYAIVANSQGCIDTTEIIFSTLTNSLTFNWPDSSWQCSFPITYGVAPVNYAVYDILWSTGDTTNQITINAPGYFTIATIDNSTGCTVNDHVYIADGILPNNPLADTTVVCNGNTAYFDISPSGYGAFDWTEYDDQWQLINNNGTWDYTVYDLGFNEYLVVDAQNVHGCYVRDTTLVDFGGTFTFSLGPDVSTMVTPYILAAPAGYPNYVWTPFAPNTNTVNVYSTTTYTLTIDNGQGCQWTDVITITILPTAITNTTSDAEVSVFPNPANDHITVESTSTISFVNIYNLNGRLVSAQSCEALQTQVNIDELPEGCYIVEAITEEGSSRSMLLKQQ